MEFDLFLWPMLVPMILPLLYSSVKMRASFKDIGLLFLLMSGIVLVYWPLITSNLVGDYTYSVMKFALFVFLPLLALLISQRQRIVDILHTLGLHRQGVHKSILWFLVLVPLMLIVTGGIAYYNGVNYHPHFVLGVVSFFESFSEEFFFRGILFLYLVKRTSLPIAYITSLGSFILMHPQHLQQIGTFFIFSTILQGILTLEIVRRSDNLIGAWLLHGTNRVFSLVVLPLLL